MLVIDDAQILERGDPKVLVEVLREAFTNETVAPERMHWSLPGGEAAGLLIMPAWRGRRAIGVKVITSIPDNPSRGHPAVAGGYLLLDGATGAMRAVLSAPALTLVRTAAVSALGTSLLARPQSRTLLMVGTGALAPHLVRAHAAVRPIEHVRIWGRDPEKARRLAEAMAASGLHVEPVADLARAAALSDVISCATHSESPLIRGDFVSPGVHVDLVGSFTPSMREADDALFRGARVLVDTSAALKESGDLLGPARAGWLAQKVPDLGDALREGLGRRSATEVTVFKAVGVGSADLAVAEHLCGLLQSEIG